MLRIDNVSYDDFIDEKTYSVQQSDEYGNTEYVDGWWRKHRRVMRQRISASIDLCFNNATDYNAFVANMQSFIDVQDCTHSVELYVNNINDTRVIEAYVAWETKTALATKAFGNAPVFWRVTLSIEER